MTTNASLDVQYGGNTKSGWLKYLPESWLPFVQLARLSPPAGLFLIFFPHLFGILHATIHTGLTATDVIRASALMFGGSLFVSNAIHIWNDLIDAPLDAKVERTRHRPIPRGAVSPTAALVFTISQAVGAALFLPLMPTGFIRTTLYSIPGIVGWTYYPWAKRYTYYPQVVLGFCLSWGIVMGSLAGGFVPFTTDGLWTFVDPSSFCLFAACTLWAIVYDTIYAHQDLSDDKKAGIKSLAVLYEGRTKPLLWQLLMAMTALLIICGSLSGMSIIFYSVAVLGSATSLGAMVWNVDLKDSRSCWFWFSNGFWLAGGSIAAGLIMEILNVGV
ncbi:4-hydroxybenzoate octaprenyltransferase [Aspergillus alliaceus]|uniref:4-hydroxybenzoate octaprenyltransferase n=1 Tax=Petromyces alliaceus TaxID=209559 RepID=UPI0012A473DE|nr:UbiA prenyltransferase [Aspergillus alliaceus]KAB8234261.1 UbiA prenyltransferase [Aspergillus alliaceus]